MPKRLQSRWYATAVGAILFALISGVLIGSPARAAAGQRVDLRVLVVSDGGPAEAIAGALDAEGVPYTKIDLASASRPTITAAYLSDTVATGPRAKFQAVVLPNENGGTLTAAEMTALANFERTFGIRQVDAYTYANPNVGLNYAVSPGYYGSLDGFTATVTALGLAGSFSYLKGPVPIEDGSPTVLETYGYLAVPLPDNATTGSSFRTLIQAPIPGTTSVGSLAGVYTHDGGRQELVLTVSSNIAQSQFREVAHGVITWMTRGVHLGYARNYFTEHVDDVFASDARWSVAGNCTPGDECTGAYAPPYTTPDIRMTSADVTKLVQWQTANSFKIHMVYNAAGSVDWIAENGSDPLTTAFLANKTQVPWINHTYSHQFLGCMQNFTVIPWQCTKLADGSTSWFSQANITSEINQNVSWATTNGVPIDRNELVTGEHSGLFVLPQQPTDNPNLAPALNSQSITVLASDNSRDPQSRRVGNARTLPRYPQNVYYNVAKKSEEIDEYNWIYTSRANGGSGICEDHPDITTCIAPLTATGYDSFIVPLEGTITLRHILANDPRPHFTHQSNLAEDQILYSLLENVLTRYRALYATNAPVVTTTMKEGLNVLTSKASWVAGTSRTTAYTLNGSVYVTVGTGAAVPVPLTVPTGTTRSGGAFGSAYANERSAMATNVSSTTPLTLVMGTGPTTA